MLEGQCVRRESREARRIDRVPGFEAGVVFAVPWAQWIIGVGWLVNVFRGVVTSLTGSGHMKLPDAKNQCRLQVYTQENEGEWETRPQNGGPARDLTMSWNHRCSCGVVYQLNCQGRS
jgi:hypothetical protein